jgi:chemosensory pili system protein ChpA (sensor histidine kinase/response regulator)
MLTQLLSPLEGLFKRLRASNMALPSDGVRLLGQSADTGRSRDGPVRCRRAAVAQRDALTAQITAMRDRYPESQVAHVVFEPQADEEPAACGSRVVSDHGNDESAMAASLDASMARHCCWQRSDDA